MLNLEKIFVTKKKLSNDLTTFIRYSIGLSDTDYETLRHTLVPYVEMPCLTSLRRYTKSLVPISKEFKSKNIVIGKHFEIESVVKDAISDTLHHFYDTSPEIVPDEIELYGGFGGDGFSNECERMGNDLNIKTTSRYIVLFKLARLSFVKKDASEKAEMIYTENSQAYHSCKPVLICCGKENQALLKLVWDFIQEKVEKLLTFYVDFHGRKILVHFKNPRFIGDGKCILNCLSIPAVFCYICSISEEEGQNIDLVIKGMPLDRSISKLRNHYKKLKAIYDT